MCLATPAAVYLSKFGLEDANTVSTPADCNKLVKDDYVSKPTDQVVYQSMVGSLFYVAMGTRPDIAQAVGAVSKFYRNGIEVHKTAVKSIFRYLKKTKNLALKYCNNDKPVMGYSDANWGGDPDDRHSTKGNVFILAGRAVSWLSKKTGCGCSVYSGSCIYGTKFSCTGGVVATHQVLYRSTKPITIKEDNQGAIALTQNPIAHSRTKHIDIHFHFICEAREDGYHYIVSLLR